MKGNGMTRGQNWNDVYASIEFCEVQAGVTLDVVDGQSEQNERFILAHLSAARAPIWSAEDSRNRRKRRLRVRF